MQTVEGEPGIETAKNGLYKLVVIGGGPAGVGVFVRAARIGLLPRLLNPTAFGTDQDLQQSQRMKKKQLGVAVVHDGDESTFGGGNLGAYIINSNIFAKSLVSSILDTRLDLCPPEMIEGTFLQNVESHATTQKLQKLGTTPVLLRDFGDFLNVVGSQLSKEIAKPTYRDTSHCLFNSRAAQFHLLKDAEGENYIRVDVVNQITKATVSIFSENIVLAFGGKQMRPKLPHPNLDKKLFLSDFCLREEGIEALRQHLLRAKSSSVCIVGGSHSAFSVAWLLLNRLTKKTQSAVSQNISSTTENVDSSRALDLGSNTYSSMDCTDTSKGINCAGKIDFGSKDITILHRSSIRCFYMNKKEAEADSVDATHADRSGSINTFTGLREDSKRLYKDILNKKECRVRLFQVQEKGNQSLSSKAYESAAAIIWSCGYTTNIIPAFTVDSEPVAFALEHGAVKLNSKAQVLVHCVSKSMKSMITPKVTPTYEGMPNVFGVGIGFHLRSSVDEMGEETRADGVTVYHRRGATLILAALFGQSVFGGDNKSFDDMVENNEKRRKEVACLVGMSTELRISHEQVFSRNVPPGPSDKQDESIKLVPVPDCATKRQKASNKQSKRKGLLHFTAKGLRQTTIQSKSQESAAVVLDRFVKVRLQPPSLSQQL